MDLQLEYLMEIQSVRRRESDWGKQMDQKMVY